MDFFDLLDGTFRSLTTEQAILLAIAAILIFMIGIVIGWIVQRTTTRRYKAELLTMRGERDDYRQQYERTTQKNKELAQALEQTSREKTALMDQLQEAGTQGQRLQSQLTALENRNEQLVVTNETYAATIDDLNNQVIGLKTKNEQLLREGAGSDSNDTSSGNQSQYLTGGGGSSFTPYLEAIEARFQAFERRLAELASGNTSTPPAGNNGGYVPTIGRPSQPQQQDTDAPPVDDPGEPLTIRADTTDPGVRTGHHGETEVIVETKPSLQVPVIDGYTREDADDLTQIDGIATFLQQKLYASGVYTYAQIAEWTEEDVAKYAKAIGTMPMAIEKHNWIDQARSLANA